MVCQIVNKKKIITFSCDHALYAFQEVEYPRMLDSLIYNMSSKYHLCWGQYNKSRFEDKLRYEKTKFLEACHPLRNQYQADINNIKNKKYSHIIVLLSQKSCFKENYEMINLVKKFVNKKMFTYSIKVHPSDNENRYNNIDFNDNLLKEVINNEKYITDLYDLSSICIFYRTSGYFELASKGVPTFKYMNEQEKYVGSNSFNNLEKLEALIKDKTNQAFWYNDEVLPWLNNMYGKFTKDPSSIYKKIICENK